MDATPAWGLLALTALCSVCTVAAVATAAILLSRRTPAGPARAEPARPRPVTWAIVRFALVALAFLGAAFLVVDLADLRPGESVKPARGLLLLVAGAATVGCLVAAARVGDPASAGSPPPAGLGYKLVAAGWTVAATALGVTLTCVSMSGPGRTALGVSWDVWQALAALATAWTVGLALVTAVRFVWINRRRIRASLTYAHEPDPRPAPAEPIILPTPVPAAPVAAPRPPRPVRPVAPPAGPRPGGAVGPVLLLIVGLLCLVYFGFVLYLEAGRQGRVPSSGWGYAALALVVGAGSLLGFAVLTNRHPRTTPGGPGHYALVAGWIVGGVILAAVVLAAWAGSGPGKDFDLAFSLLGGCFAPVLLILIVATVARQVWLGRREFAEPVRHTREPGPRPATPVLPSSAVSPKRVCPKCGAAVAADAAQGLCPRCLLAAMMPLPERLSPTIAHGPFVPPTVEEVAEFFPQFEVLRIVGQGGMGAVYLARQKALDRTVAIKLIRTAHEDDPTFAARFAREARAMAKLSHPNIVAVHDTGEAGGLPFLVMEYVDGVTLRDAIRTKSLTSAQALLIIPQICDALEYAHKQGVVHRDIKPENILLDATGKVKIADFGLAKLTDPDSMSLTGTMQAMGTPHYMAPEQWEKPGEVDHRADIYALGVVLYELLTGELPLGRFDPPSVKSRVDARIDELVLRALAKEPGRRYQHATDVKLALAKIAASPGWVRRTGYEYKSKAVLLGWPLVHVATGRDPATGYGKIAKGWIAVGSGAAVGGIAVGGVTAMGGIAVGGTMALGGVAVAGGCAGGILALGGGVAVGALAAGAGGAAAAAGLAGAGGIAAGEYAIAGGMASGEHVWASNQRDPDFWPSLNGTVSALSDPVKAFFGKSSLP